MTCDAMLGGIAAYVSQKVVGEGCLFCCLLLLRSGDVSVVSVNAGRDTSFPVCVDGDAVMMNKGVTATVSVYSYAVYCTFVCWCVLIPRFVGMF